MKKRFILIIVTAIVILICVAIVLIVLGELRQHCDKEQWKSIKEIVGIADFFDTPINEMTLREGVTSAECTVFSDDDLIADWNFFLDNAEVKHDGKATDNNSQSSNGNGATMLVTAVNADGKKLSLGIYSAFGELKLFVGGNAYTIKNTFGPPFKSTLWRAIKRHGVTTPWD